MFMINCYNVTEDEWYEVDDVPIIECHDVEDEQEAMELKDRLEANYLYVQLIEQDK